MPRTALRRESAGSQAGRFGPGAGGWSSDDLYKRELADVTVPAADFAGFVKAGVFIEIASSPCGLVPSIGNECANGISKRKPDQNANKISAKGVYCA